MSQAYQQILLEDESKKYTTINTHKVLFQYKRLPYGVSSSPGIFQRTMENLLQGIPFVVVRVDDIFVSGSNDEEHLANLEEVLKRLSEHGCDVDSEKYVACRELSSIYERWSPGLARFGCLSNANNVFGTLYFIETSYILETLFNLFFLLNFGDIINVSRQTLDIEQSSTFRVL
jgi:hypothetical protein